MKRLFKVAALFIISALFVLGCDPVGPSANEGFGEPPDEPVAVTPVSPGFHDQSDKTSGENYEHWLFMSRLVPGTPLSEAQTAREAYLGENESDEITYRYNSYSLLFSDAGSAKTQGPPVGVRVMLKSPDGKLLGVANARVPDTDEARAAFGSEVAERFGLAQDKLTSLAVPSTKSAARKEMCAGGGGQIIAEWTTCNYSGCSIDYVLVCGGGGSSGGGGWGGGSGGGGGSGDGGGSGAPSGPEGGASCIGCGGSAPVDACATNDLNVLIANGCIDPAPPEDPTVPDDPVPLDEPVPKVEVVELIRDACSDVSGVTLPGDDGRLGGYFESSVRKSLNDALPEDRKFNYDLPDTDTHPRLTRDVDGYATAVTVDGTPLNQFLSSILEAKFSERPSNSLPSDQWQDHIDDLSRSYNEMRDEIPDDEYTIAKPQYLIVTNTQFSDIGDLGGDQSIRIPSYAASKNVNVMHLRVTKNEYGQYRLSGDLIGTADTLSFLADLLKDIDIPFSVECDKNK